MQYTAGKISNGRITIFLSKFISKDAVDTKVSRDVGKNPNNPYMQRKQNNMFRNVTTGKSIELLKHKMYLILCTKAFVGNESFKMPPVGETSHMYLAGILSSNLEGFVASSMNFDLIFYWIQVRWLAGNSSSFIFFL